MAIKTKFDELLSDAFKTKKHAVIYTVQSTLHFSKFDNNPMKNVILLSMAILVFGLKASSQESGAYTQKKQEIIDGVRAECIKNHKDMTPELQAVFCNCFADKVIGGLTLEEILELTKSGGNPTGEIKAKIDKLNQSCTIELAAANNKIDRRQVKESMLEVCQNQLSQNLEASKKVKFCDCFATKMDTQLSDKEVGELMNDGMPPGLKEKMAKATDDCMDLVK